MGAARRSWTTARGFTVNWRRLFHQLADPCLGMDELSLARPHKHSLAQDLLVAGPITEQLPSQVVSVDTSGSISSDFLNRVFTEVEKLAELAEECLLIVEDLVLDKEIDQQPQYMAAHEVDHHLNVQGVPRVAEGHGGNLHGGADAQVGDS